MLNIPYMKERRWKVYAFMGLACSFIVLNWGNTLPGLNCFYSLLVSQSAAGDTATITEQTRETIIPFIETLSLLSFYVIIWVAFSRVLYVFDIDANVYEDAYNVLENENKSARRSLEDMNHKIERLEGQIAALASHGPALTLHTEALQKLSFEINRLEQTWTQGQKRKAKQTQNKEPDLFSPRAEEIEALSKSGPKSESKGRRKPPRLQRSRKAPSF